MQFLKAARIRHIYYLLAREKKFEKINYNFLAYETPRLPMSVHKIFHPVRSSRLAGYKEHIYECRVLSYRCKYQSLFEN